MNNFIKNINITKEEIDNFIYINENTTIVIDPPQFQNNDEPLYFDNLNKIFKALETHNRTYNIKIKVENRELLKQANLLNYPHINLIIKNDGYDYTKEEYLKEEEQLDKIITPIKESNLSPYEKYLAVYNIVKQFKPYKENEDNRYHARELRYILNNEYIVCVGFAKLLTTLLDKVGIPSMTIAAAVDTSYDNGFTMEDIPTDLEGHERNIIKIDDDKYNIHGIFIADATWDNDIENDLYNYSSMTFERLKETKRLEKISEEDLLLDFHTFDEFLDKINFYIRRRIKRKYYGTEKENIIYAYSTIYHNIMDILVKLDYQKYKQLYAKYNDLISSKANILTFNQNSSLKEIEDIFSKFLTEYSTYIIPLSNQTINNNTLLQAATNIKLILDTYTNEELEIWLDETKIINSTEAKKNFPYLYNPNETRINYLSSNEGDKKR